PGATIFWNNISRVTNFVNASQITAAILSSDVNVAAGAKIPVTAQNQAPTAGISNVVSFALNNPVPRITSIAPVNATAGSALFLTVNGTGIVPGAIIQVGDQGLTTSSITSSSIS